MNESNTPPNPPNTPSKPPPCDQCRRRKVRCDAGAPCDRCVRSELRCTRDIIRKRRGPKKGSGSVIAKLRNEDGTTKSNGIDLPSYGMLPMDIQSSDYGGSMSGDSPLASPLSGHFQSGFGPTSAPNSAANGFEYPTGGEFWHIGHGPLQYSSPESSDGFVSVSELARLIFKTEDITIPNLSTIPTHQSLPEGLNGQISTPSTPIRPSIESPVNSNTSLHAYDGPRFLYRSNSGTPGVENKISVLAAQVNMSPMLMSQCVKQYFKHLYPIMPMIHERTFNLQLNRNDSFSAEEKCLLLSMCAITVLHAAPPSDISLETKKELGRKFLSCCLNIRSSFDWIEQASLNTVITSFFIALSFFDLKQSRSHLFYLREAIGLALEQNLQHGSAPGSDKIQSICSDRLFALLFVTERGYAILRNKPIIISRLARLPVEHFDDENPEILAGFQCICRLFALLDDTFVELWGNAGPLIEDAYTVLDDVAAIQQNLSNLSFAEVHLTDIQKADVLITQQWLRLIFWQASMKHGLVSGGAKEPFFSYDYPIVVAKMLCAVMNNLPLEAILVHGLGIFEKIFEVAYTLMDALTIRRSPWSESEELRYLFSCLSASPNSHHTYVRMLENKMSLDDSMAAEATQDQNAMHISATGLTHVDYRA